VGHDGTTIKKIKRVSSKKGKLRESPPMFIKENVGKTKKDKEWSTI